MHIPLRRLVRHIGRYEAIAFIAGFVLMVYELAASRILAPTIGTSIYVWTSVIGVMIAALAFGYAAGGWVADRRAAATDVAWLLMAAAVGVTITCVFYSATLMTVVIALHDPRLQGVLASVLLFAPASFTLGMVSPYLAKLRINSLHTSGRSVAGLSALNSFGGITGTFLAGFVFFNYIGSQTTLLLLVLVLLGCSWVISPRRFVRERVIASAVICLTLALQLAAPVQAGTVADIDTPTSHYKIIDVIQDWRPLRVLVMGPGGYQSGVYTSGPKDLAFSYTRKIADVVQAAPRKNHILILGGGAFTLPEYLGRQYPHSTIDVVELDPQLPAIAKQYFRYDPPSNVHVIAKDARSFLRTTTGRYDIVAVDVYNDESVPFSMATREYAADLKHALQPDGVVAANLIAGTNPTCLPLLTSMHSSYHSAFAYSRIYPLLQQDGMVKQNIIAVYSNAALEWAATLNGENTNPLTTNRALTDDFAPTERLIQQCR